MSRLDRLIRLAKSQLDEQRLILNTLEKNQDDLKRRHKELEESLEREIETAPLEFREALESYLRSVKEQCRTLDLGIQKLSVEIETARDQLREEFRNVKTLESAAQKEREEQLRIFKKKEGELLDESASRRS